MDTYGCDVRQIRAAIGPSISQDAYEVDQPVLERFRQAFSFAGQLIVPMPAAHPKNPVPYLPSPHGQYWRYGPDDRTPPAAEKCPVPPQRAAGFAAQSLLHLRW